MTRIHSTTLVAVLTLSTACAGLEPPMSLRVDRSLNVGNMGARNSFELRNGVGVGDPEPASDSSDSPRARRPVTPLLFWIGIGLTAAGGGTVIGSAAGAAATRNQLRTAYSDGTTAARIDELEQRGSNLNKVSLAGAVLMVAGAIMAITTYGYDYTRCGPLAPKRRRDTAPPGRCAAPDSK
ncbi:MAG: hypothetical protein H0T76_00660 [Nannocystis sp.]|nr:hypothetical protein [Nannocystis sp.]MBA3544971.1 hypothetical protein [Nannocystis sp.]